jgi:putative transposase
MERKKRYLILHREGGNFRRLCAVLKISHQTGYDWIKRFEQGGLDALLQDNPGGRPSQQVPTELREAVLALRKEHGWNEKKIHESLDKELNASYHAIRKTLTEAKVLGVAPPRTKRAFREFERPLPNHLWQADFSLLDDDSWLFALMDDHSRYLVDAMEFEEASTENALFVCRRAVQRHGTPFQLISDHGVQFWNSNRKCPNAFGQILGVWGVEHILAGIRHPQTCGKLERWFGCFKNESPRFRGLEEYVYYYNFDRPHGGIGYQKPYEKYFAYVL